MEHEPPDKREKRSAVGGGLHEPPPFQPDPRLVDYLEGGSRRDAVRRFKAELEKQQRRRAR
jgi:hypothetical protein